jgi:hypothetical protein
MTAADRFESVNSDFVEPGVDLFHEVRLRVSGFGWWTSGPGGGKVLSDWETAYVSLSRTVVSGSALVSPILSSCC